MGELIRKKYLDKLVNFQDSRFIKIISGSRGVGKSHLLLENFKNHLLNEGVNLDQIVIIELEKNYNANLRNPLNFIKFVQNELLTLNEKIYLFIDDIDLMKSVYLENESKKVNCYTFLNYLFTLENVSSFVTTSNISFYEDNLYFKGKGINIPLFPLSYSEIFDFNNDFKIEEYLKYGGLIGTIYLSNKEKEAYLNSLINEIISNDIKAKNNIKNDNSIFKLLLETLALFLDQNLTIMKITEILEEKNININNETISSYMDILKENNILNEEGRYVLKLKRNLETSKKYYFNDLGLVSSLLNFNEVSLDAKIKNMIFNELRYRGYEVSSALIENFYKDKEAKTIREYLEVDFLAKNFDKKVYVQFLEDISSKENLEKVVKPFSKIKDHFKKIVVTKQLFKPKYDENGILFVGLKDFLLKKEILY